MNNLKKFVLAIALMILCLDLLAQDNKPLYTFGVVTDVQYADINNKGTRYYRSSLKKLKEAVTVFNDKKVDFVINLGDIINNDIRSYDTLLNITSYLKMPVYYALGNHDFAGSSEEILSILKMTAPYYSFVKKGWRFVVLDSNDISLYTSKNDSNKQALAKKILANLKDRNAPNATNWNGALGNVQIEWLKNEITSAQKKNEKVILCTHSALFPDETTELQWNAPEMRMLIESYPNVFAYFNGHVHVCHFIKHGGVNYISFAGMVEGDENAYAIVSVFADSLQIKGFGREMNRSLK